MAGEDRGVAIVTGASRGIGAAIALRAADAGYAVLVNYSADAAGAASVVQEIREGGGDALAHQADVSDPAAVGPMFDRAATLGPVTAVINNAGITGNLIGTLVDVPPATVRRVMDVNVSGLIYVCQEAVRRLGTGTGGTGGPGGSIVNISSTATKAGSPGTGMPDRVERLNPTIPMGRGAEPDEVAAAVMWLLSGEAGYVTGALLPVAGGR